MREAFQEIFNSLAYHVTAKGEGGEMDGQYVNAIPSRMEIKVDVSNLDRKITVICVGDEHFYMVFGKGTQDDPG